MEIVARLAGLCTSLAESFEATTSHKLAGFKQPSVLVTSPRTTSVLVGS